MKNLKISDAVAKKIKNKRQVDQRKVEQCFANRVGKLLEAKRAQHKTNPPTLWFLAKTNKGRFLKIVYIHNGMMIDLRSAFEPNAAELTLFATYGSVAY